MSDAKIRLENIGKVFGTGDGAFVALEGLTLDIRPGEFLAIVGPSGSGKTTVLNMLAGLDAPTSGTMLLDGRPITAPGPVSVSSGLCVGPLGSIGVAAARAIPKSSTFTRPSSPIITLSGLMSRCTRPRSWAAPSAAATSRSQETRRSTGIDLSPT